jgi:uncharacterized protein (UPF0335 family)
MADHLEMGTGANSSARLKSFIERVARLKTEQKASNAEFNEDIKAVLDEAKGVGYDVKIIRQIAKLAQQEEEDKDALAEQWAVLEMYGRAYGLGIFS